MNAPAPGSVRWVKSSFSTNNGVCVEVASVPSLILARDSKNADGPVLSFLPSSWAAFLTKVAGQHSRDC